MSRIQEILRKAEREGGVHRTRALTVDPPATALADTPVGTRGAVTSGAPVTLTVAGSDLAERLPAASAASTV